MNFFRTPFFLPWLYPGLTWRIPVQDKVLFLTFDDGPVPGPTQFVLETLAARKALATFFCIGDNVVKHTPIYRDVVRNGHAVGNHTFNHLKGWKTSVSEYRNNIAQCDAVLEGNIRLFRPPYGRITRAQIKSLPDYRIIMWDVLTHDYAASISPERCLRGSIQATRPGSVVVFHDSVKAEKNLLYVLPRYMDHFSELGYTFKTIKPD